MVFAASMLSFVEFSIRSVVRVVGKIIAMIEWTYPIASLLGPLGYAESMLLERNRGTHDYR